MRDSFVWREPKITLVMHSKLSYVWISGNTNAFKFGNLSLRLCTYVTFWGDVFGHFFEKYYGSLKSKWNVSFQRTCPDHLPLNGDEGLAITKQDMLLIKI